VRRKVAIFTLTVGILILVNLLVREHLTTSAAFEHPPYDYHAAPQQDTPSQEEPLPEIPAGEQPSDAYCLLCHTAPDRVWTLPSGEVLPLEVDTATLAGSVHGENNPEGALGCSDCHVNQTFPHQTPASQNIREFKLERYASCMNCHEDQYTHSQDSVHGAAVLAGKLNAATCVDCHGGHDIQPPNDPPQRISITCGQCHGAIYAEYEQSVHGAALLREGSTDVPNCIDCHGVHDIQSAKTAEFRNRSPQLCADCHADEELMGKYDISTNVFDSYLNEFHGSTVALFEQQDPSVPTNKAVCFDCHGVHNITAADNEKSQVAKENLLITCQQCHPDATGDFPDSWVGHFAPTLEDNPGLVLVNLFYQILIPATVGGFAVLVVSDIFGRTRKRFWGKHKD